MSVSSSRAGGMSSVPATNFSRLRWLEEREKQMQFKQWIMRELNGAWRRVTTNTTGNLKNASNSEVVADKSDEHILSEECILARRGSTLVGYSASGIRIVIRRSKLWDLGFTCLPNRRRRISYGDDQGHCTRESSFCGDCG